MKVKIFTENLNVVNLGLASFGDNITRAGGTATTLDWRPPAGGDVDLGLDLARLMAHPDVEKANTIAFDHTNPICPARKISLSRTHQVYSIGPGDATGSTACLTGT